MSRELRKLIGRQLGCYEIQCLLGSGGMATVYRGFDQNLQRPVAIKVLSQAAAEQPGFAERFRQEARMIAGLHHPHIVQVYSFGQQGPYTYMVQELLPGPTLEQYLQNLTRRSRLLGRQDIISIATQLASALDVAHAAGIVHRDVKPGNALWNAANALVLTDFGVARHILAESSQAPTGLVVGTPNYLSPEQARGLPGTQASDIYALGVVVYEMITGRVPFTGSNRGEVIQQHIRKAPPPLHTLRSDVLPAVEGVVLRAMAKDPRARFSSAGELARALRRAWPPTYTRVHHVAPDKEHGQVLSLWRDASTNQGPEAHSSTSKDGTPISIHAQTTVVTVSSEHAQHEHPTHETGAPAPRPQSQSLRSTLQRQRRMRQTVPVVLGGIIALVILAASVLSLRNDYEQTPRMAPDADLIAPTLVPTARVTNAASAPGIALTTIDGERNPTSPAPTAEPEAEPAPAAAEPEAEPAPAAAEPEAEPAPAAAEPEPEPAPAAAEPEAEPAPAAEDLGEAGEVAGAQLAEESPALAPQVAVLRGLMRESVAMARSTAAPAPPPPPEERVLPTAPAAETEPVPVAVSEDGQPITDQFALLRMLIEAEDDDGWARIDQTAWLHRLEEIERAVDAGDTQRAAVWLDEMRQALLRNARAGTIEADAARRVLTNIDTIASSNGIALPPVNEPAVGDG